MWDHRREKELERKGRDCGLEKETMNYSMGSWTFPHGNWLLGSPVPAGAFNRYVKLSNINWIFSVCAHCCEHPASKTSPPKCLWKANTEYKSAQTESVIWKYKLIRKNSSVIFDSFLLTGISLSFPQQGKFSVCPSLSSWVFVRVTHQDETQILKRFFRNNKKKGLLVPSAEIQLH